MQELNFSTLYILSISKIILFLFLFLVVWALFKKNKPYIYLLTFTASTSSFYFFLSRPLQKLFWGNNGDEVFIFSFLNKVVHHGLAHDFYYDWLPQFYPPLYFWVTGTVSKFFTNNGIGAAKIGVLLTLLLWFTLPYLWQKLYWEKIGQKEKNNIAENKWFWLLVPIIYFISLDFDALILKPYETLPALFSILFIGLLAENFQNEKWGIKNYLFFGISGGILFLEYYFWWIILIPTMFILAALSKKFLNLKRIIFIGIIMLVVACPYLIPLLKSYITYGVENWQAFYFVPENFAIFAPWAHPVFRSIIFIFGLFGLILFRKNLFIKANLALFVCCYLYQFINVIFFISGNKTFAPGKPFLFLAGATLTVGASYLIIHIYKILEKKYSSAQMKPGVLVLILLFLPLMPFVKFIDEPVVLNQLEIDQNFPSAYYLKDKVKEYAPDYEKYTWLSSGIPEINAYLPLSYYIAYNPHFSHHASIYSHRLAEVEKMTEAKTAEEFMNIIDQGSPRKIDALLLYNDGKEKDFYPLFFWADNFPNGGEVKKINLPKNIITKEFWNHAYSGEWDIFIKK